MLTLHFLMVQVSEFSLSDLLRFREFVEGVSSAPLFSAMRLMFLVFTSLVPSEFLPAFLAESFRFARIMMAYNIAIRAPTLDRDLTQFLSGLPQMPTCLPQLHFQMLISHLVGLSILARQMIRFYSPFPGQLGCFPMVCLHNSGKSSYGIPSHPQCDCWFSHWHTIGSGEPSLASISLELMQGVVLQLFDIARSSRMGYSWYVANVLIYAYESSAFRQLQRLP